ncbi:MULTISPECIES: hypothetical protein [Thiothrix]|jgi:hypothetical protein|uniref:Uncharacterized protein n=2 Tax=Thiothrix TaxID=1030 RepID=A0A975FB78_9GAMM|nr:MULTISPECIES: hypothetical protein [Thiothrix]MDX9989841.1 hypothetical protein [Thiothrix unzii]OQX10347.1 MAG: hypothetical protein BWK73_20575 [Thiothrix lacustris]QTR53790.1 hypothetical protein J9260_01485 [Thiothrix unzii]
MQAHYSRMITAAGLAFVLMATSSICNVAHANLTSKVRLVATLNGQPALQEANWTIFSVNDRQHPAAVLPRHTGTVLLSPGFYRATISLDNKTKQTDFHVETDADNVIRVAMD